MRAEGDSFPVAARTLDADTLGDHEDRLYRAAWGLCRSREDAEDLVQETYANVLARPRLLRRGEDLGYLLRTLRNAFLAGRRGLAAQTVTVPFDEELDGTGGHDVGEFADLIAAIGQLPLAYRRALVAVDVTGLSYREAARVFGVPEGTVTSRLARARERVAEQLA
jgi:RNA polymerase sigma-70 factor, ECF subfamily